MTRRERFPAPRTVRGDPSPERAPSAPPVRLRDPKVVEAPREGGEPIAVVGIGCVLPDAPDVPTFWGNLLRGHDAVDEVPPSRWDVARHWQPDPPAGVWTRSRMAGTVRHLDFDPVRFRVPPASMPAIDRAQQLALLAASEATDGLDLPRERAAVILGNAMGGEYAKHLAIRARTRWQLALLDAAGDLAGNCAEIEARLHTAYEGRLPPIGPDSLAGSLANVIAGRVASWLDWTGGNLVVDAACASSLAALHVAVDQLRARRIDVALTGGVDADLSVESFVGFSATGALSSDRSRPFASDSDGFVLGEGAAALVLVRLDDALEAGLPVWAVVRGVGQASDGRGRSVTAPRPEGQRLAIRRAWADAGVSGAELGMIEAHGTGTPIGDPTEAAVLAELLDGGSGPVWLGSVKSNIGHLKGAAGAAALVKAVISVATAVVPPTLHAAPHLPDIHPATLRLPRHAARLARPMAGVSAFGFGGTDYHAVVEAPPPEANAPRVIEGLPEAAIVSDALAAWPSASSPSPRLWAFGADDDATLRARVVAGRHRSVHSAASAAARVVVRDGRWLDTVVRWLAHDDGSTTLGRIGWRGEGPPAAVSLVIGEAPGAGEVGRFAVGAARLQAGDAAVAAWRAVLADAGIPLVEGGDLILSAGEVAGAWRLDGDADALLAAAAALLAGGHAGLASALERAEGWRTAAAAPVGRRALATPPEPVVTQAQAPVSEDVRAVVIATIAEVSGYPPELLDGGVALEADLGIDSIRKVEILSRLQERLDFPASDADHAVLTTADVDALVAFVTERRGAVAAGATPTPGVVIPLDPLDPALADHVVAGRAIVPLAWWVEAIVAAADRDAPHAAWEIDDLEVTGPTVVVTPRSDVRLVRAGSPRSVEIRAGVRRVVSATVRPGALPPVSRVTPVALAPAAGLYERLLFHGPRWQVIEALRADEDGEVAARLHLGAEGRRAGALDGVLQAAAVWGAERAGFLALPVGIARVVLATGDWPARLALSAEARLDGADIVVDAVARGADGRAWLWVEGARLRRAGDARASGSARG